MNYFDNLYNEETPLVFTDGTKIYDELKKNIKLIKKDILYMDHQE